MFLALIIPAFLSPCLVVTVYCGNSQSGHLSNLTSNNRSLAFSDLIFTPFGHPTTPLHLLQTEYPHLLISPNNSILKYNLLKDGTSKAKLSNSESVIQRSGPARMPKLRGTAKDYGESSHYRMKKASGSSRKSYYMNLLQTLLRPSKKDHDYTSKGLLNKYGFQHKSSSMSAPGWGWGWGKGGGGGGHGHGYSLLDVLLCGLSLLSLGGFLLNLLLNLMNLFGFGMMTSTSTYPVTVTQTQTATAPAGGTGGTTGGIVTGTVLSALAGSAAGSGLGITGRTIDSMAGNRNANINANGNGNNGWGWGWDGNQANLQLHIQLPQAGWGWNSSTTTTTPPPTLTGTFPTATGTGITLDPVNVGRKRHKRETFQPYVDPATALDIFAKAVLNSINSAMNNYECMEKILCENNKRARVIGQWLDYFMPVYSLSVSYIGRRNGAHDNLLNHIRAIVLGATETNCQAHFPRCEGEEATSWDFNLRP